MKSLPCQVECFVLAPGFFRVSYPLLQKKGLNWVISKLKKSIKINKNSINVFGEICIMLAIIKL